MKNLTGGARAETEERWSGQEFVGQEKGKFSSKSPDFNHLCAVDWRWKKPRTSFQPSDARILGKKLNFWKKLWIYYHLNFICLYGRAIQVSYFEEGSISVELYRRPGRRRSGGSPARRCTGNSGREGKGLSAAIYTWWALSVTKGKVLFPQIRNLTV